MEWNPRIIIVLYMAQSDKRGDGGVRKKKKQIFILPILVQHWFETEKKNWRKGDEGILRPQGPQTGAEAKLLGKVCYASLPLLL